MADQTNDTQRQLSDFELQEVTLYERGTLPPGVGFYPVVNSCGQWCNILTLQEFDAVPNGATVIGILSGKHLTKGTDYIDTDTRGGQIAFALPYDDKTSQWLDERYPDARANYRKR